jgi:uncharacterized protein (TIGR02001 family)
MMKTLNKYILTLVSAVGATAALTATVRAEMPVQVEAGVDVVSKYVWRGQLLNDDPVVQPSLTLALGGFSLNLWGSIDTTDWAGDGEEWNIQEIDYTLSYGFTPYDGLDLEVGWIRYDFPGTGLDSTHEVYVSATASNLPLSPALTAYYDYDEVDGFYLTAGLSHEFELREDLTLGLEAAVGFGDSDYNLAYFGVDDTALSDVALTVTLGYAINEHVSVSGYVRYTEILDSTLEKAADAIYGDSDNLTAGVNVTVAF